MSKNYGDESIRSQSAIETCRNNLPTFFGSTDVQGALHSIKEILSNAVDEEKVKDVNERGKITVTIHKDNSVTIKDEGRGLPLDWNKGEDTWNWILNLQTLHAGGKFEDNRQNFKNSTGMNGLGLAVTAMSSAWMKVESKYNGFIYNVELKKGAPIVDNPDKVLKKEKDPKGKSQQTGTTISWKCDTDEVYLDDNFDLNFLKDWCKTQAILTDGTSVILKDERVNFTETYKYEDGIKTFAEESIGKDVPVIEFNSKGNGKDAAKFKSYDVECRVLFAFTDKKPESYYYHNSLPLTLGGSPQKAEQNAFLDFFQKQTKNKKLEFSDIQETLFYISNTLTQISPTFRNQTKDAIDMPFIEQFLTGKITKQLEEWAKKNPLELDKICQQVTVNQEARTSAGAQRQLTKEKLSGKIKLSQKIEKLTECDSDDVNITECYFCEGDSASSIKDARDAKFQAIYALRGKIVNVLKMNLNDILNKPVLMEVIKVIGTGIHIGDKKQNKIGDFDFNNRRFGKYIIASDADVDGDHIASLLITLFYKLMPELLEKGCVYRLMAPLFVNKMKDGTKKEAYNDDEQAEIIKKYGNQIKKTNRYKGLGEWNGEDFEPYMAPETRKLVQYTIEDAKKSAEQIELWMGDDSNKRKDYLSKHGSEFQDLDFNGAED